jgi:hypothetical protein
MLFTGLYKFRGKQLCRASYYWVDTTTVLQVYREKDSYMQMAVIISRARPSSRSINSIAYRQ